MREHYVYAHKQHMPNGEAKIKGKILLIVFAVF